MPVKNWWDSQQVFSINLPLLLISLLIKGSFHTCAAILILSWLYLEELSSRWHTVLWERLQEHGSIRPKITPLVVWRSLSNESWNFMKQDNPTCLRLKDLRRHNPLDWEHMLWIRTLKIRKEIHRIGIHVLTQWTWTCVVISTTAEEQWTPDLGVRDTKQKEISARWI